MKAEDRCPVCDRVKARIDAPVYPDGACYAHLPSFIAVGKRDCQDHAIDWRTRAKEVEARLARVREVLRGPPPFQVADATGPRIMRWMLAKIERALAACEPSSETGGPHEP